MVNKDFWNLFGTYIGIVTGLMTLAGIYYKVLPSNHPLKKFWLKKNRDGTRSSKPKTNEILAGIILIITLGFCISYIVTLPPDTPPYSEQAKGDTVSAPQMTDTLPPRERLHVLAKIDGKYNTTLAHTMGSFIKDQFKVKQFDVLPLLDTICFEEAMNSDLTCILENKSQNLTKYLTLLRCNPNYTPDKVDGVLYVDGTFDICVFDLNDRSIKKSFALAFRGWGRTKEIAWNDIETKFLDSVKFLSFSK